MKQPTAYLTPQSFDDHPEHSYEKSHISGVQVEPSSGRKLASVTPISKRRWSTWRKNESWLENRSFRSSRDEIPLVGSARSLFRALETFLEWHRSVVSDQPAEDARTSVAMNYRGHTTVLP